LAAVAAAGVVDWVSTQDLDGEAGESEQQLPLGSGRQRSRGVEVVEPADRGQQVLQ